MFKNLGKIVKELGEKLWGKYVSSEKYFCKNLGKKLYKKLWGKLYTKNYRENSEKNVQKIGGFVQKLWKNCERIGENLCKKLQYGTAVGLRKTSLLHKQIKNWPCYFSL